MYDSRMYNPALDIFYGFAAIHYAAFYDNNAIFYELL